MTRNLHDPGETLARSHDVLDRLAVACRHPSHPLASMLRARARTIGVDHSADSDAIALLELGSVFALYSATWSPELFVSWLHSPASALRGRRPIDAFVADGPAPLETLLTDLDKETERW